MRQDVHTDISGLLELLQATGKKYDLEKIKSAFEYAKDLHEGQFRASGEAYISHPIAVAEIVAGLELDTDSICAALLHDTVEDCSEKTSLKDLEKKFGPDVALLVDGLTKIVTLQVEDKEEAHIETLRKMLLAMSRDIRVIFIKLCDRLHNLRTLNAKPDPKRRVTALETMHVYAPLAHRLGMQRVKLELENTSLQYLDPIGHEEVLRHIESKYGENENFLDKIKLEVGARMKENGIHYTLEGRIKSVYSIYKKMYNQNKSFDQIYDFYALRIIVNTELECYTALGLIHEMYNSIPGRFKDYISTPKPNMYRSLHTTVIGRDGIPFEVQIRTWDMHHIAEYGIAAHWKYKSGASSKEEIDKRLEWVAKLIEMEDEQRDPEEFLDALKTDIFHDEVFVFSPKGDVFTLPHGANLIDFAYAVHSKVAERMIGGKINGMIVPIDRELKSGEIVEIITSSASKGPSRNWLNMVKTSAARSKIRAWFKKEKRADNILVGKASVDSEIKRHRKSCSETQRDEIVTAISSHFGFNSPDDLYNAIGYGGVSITKFARRIQEECERVIKIEEPVLQEPVKIPVVSKPKNVKSDSGIIVDGEVGCMVKFAKCCNPLPGDPVIGFVTKGFGISIHKQDCPNVVQSQKNPENEERWKAARWEGSATQGNGASIYEALLQIYVDDRIGMLADITTTLADMRVSILQLNVTARGNESSIVNLKIGCKNIDHCNFIVSRLRGLRGVDNILRGFS
ncbi:MAG: bifunctional (p)ppGpp synthetase/guanosine-3',5'-bis(diphosphate) 3'-pyrophosphohydrolase [Ruminococcaceae bacterium]|nr:bifunctional (p)ppGpp synthetase/guanosine-3',5'-bis(diphosphate) 3'-pyrophosphohydrolase [Oscillospiraceae bacterium]